MIEVKGVRVRGDDGNVIAELGKRTRALDGESYAWRCPYGGTFEPSELEELDAFARGERSTVTIGKGSRWEHTHERARVEVLFEAASINA